MYLLDYFYMIIIVVLMYMDEEPNYSLKSPNKPLNIIVIIIIIMTRIEMRNSISAGTPDIAKCHQVCGR